MPEYGLIGKRLDYSFSKAFFTAFFEQNGLGCRYENIELDSLENIGTILKSGRYSGLNVTIPYKEEIIPFLDELSPEAREIGAVNTIAFRDGRTIGHNTDAFGFHQSIKPFLNNKHERALVLGSGGASKAVVHVLKKIGLDVLLISRSPQGEKEFSYSEINLHMINACKLIVNCTPVGTYPDIDEKPELPTEFIGPEHLVADLVYNPEKTRLLREAEAKGALILNGHSMLREQALQAWKIWNEGE